LISRNGLTDFLFSDNISNVENWGGRMGAALAHILVYEGVGVAALAIGIWLSYLGSLLIYGRKKIPSVRYMRWLPVLLLIAAPVLAYLAPTASFPYGGALGNEAVAYLNGLMGVFGTGLTILTLTAFLLFVIFALDISPIVNRARNTAQTLASSLTPEPI